eukprot:CAMPEP_0175307186 /NCGR_PEP_ID=MMETSP0093-20121207/64637_1 /TAXON_ID=311494 /ORGANISM="Alexandrium monilatum, Strain CCMP3105" /LENGTH=166 /DNA_ID=CAMNT_0016603651 /DNA_START=67 /DNA_END=564 /DNA_ORIENTATION=+
MTGGVEGVQPWEPTPEARAAPDEVCQPRRVLFHNGAEPQQFVGQQSMGKPLSAPLPAAAAPSAGRADAGLAAAQPLWIGEGREEFGEVLQSLRPHGFLGLGSSGPKLELAEWGDCELDHLASLAPVPFPAMVWLGMYGVVMFTATGTDIMQLTAPSPNTLTGARPR